METSKETPKRKVSSSSKRKETSPATEVILQSQAVKVKKKYFNPSKSITRAHGVRVQGSTIKSAGVTYSWDSELEKVKIIREGLPYIVIEGIGVRTNSPTKRVLELIGIPQTTYNLKKRKRSLLSGRESELVLVLTELLDFGKEVFNNENEKFQHWIKKPNISLGGVAPESLFDSLTGIKEVKKSLNRIEYGNMA